MARKPARLDPAERTLAREDWLRAARLALLRGGAEAVRVAKLARDLKVTKGSFYWHFKDRDELLEMLLREWENELSEIVPRLGGATGRRALAALMEILIERARLSEEGAVPSDAAIFAWASVEPRVAKRVNRAEQERIELLARLVRNRRRVEVLYLAWLGFVARGQRVPSFRKRFPEIARSMLDLLASTTRTRKARLMAALLLGLAAAGPAAPSAGARLPGQETTPSGIRRHTAVYVPMRDGVEIAVDVWLPPDHRQGDRRPVLMRTTRYWRAQQVGWAMRLLVKLHLMHVGENPQRAYFNRRGFVVLAVDSRGSGASGGRRLVEYSPDEVADLGEVAAWAARQPWSNGRVGTFGISYEGNTAELAAVPNQPAVRAVMPLYDDLDSQALVQPGGVLLRGFVQEWSEAVAALDRNDVCALQHDRGWKCRRDRLIVPGVERVDSDPRGKRLAELVKQHHNLDVAAALSKVEYRDDALATAHGSFRFQDLSPYGMRRQIEASGVPMMVWCGWLDASPCEGALIRYRTFSNPQVVVIGPLSHGGSFNVDPFAASHRPPAPPLGEQHRMEADFFDRLLRQDPPDKIDSTIQYYTMGEGAWHTTATWPPAGFPTVRLHFAEGRSLSASPPPAAPASDSYEVDFTATSGKQTRWHTQLGGGDVVYPDRAAEDRKLLTYTGPPLASDVEITGSPVLTLVLASTASDGAVHAYLEDVAPDGRVTYLDEGIFRVIHRKEVDPRTLPYEPLGPAHSFLRRDAEPLRPGEAATVRFALYPTSMLLRKGHRVRIALAGSDAGLFARYPAAGPVTWTLYREPDRASYLELPLKPR